MKLLILISVLCASVLARPDGYHVQDAENKFHTSSRQALSNIKSLSVHNDSPKVGFKIAPQFSTLSYAPATAVAYTHTGPSAAGGSSSGAQQHSFKQALPLPHPPQPFLVQPSTPAQLHYAPNSRYQGASHQVYQAPVQSHHQVPYVAPALIQPNFQPFTALGHQEPTGPQHEIVESISTSAYYEPSYQKDAVIHKHVYVHVPPQEKEEVQRPIIHYQPAQKQKHYKIIFVKAPSYQAKAPVVHVPSVQNEEKTLVYVLYKKPEKAEDIVIPEPKPTKMNKPEVYFINYKTEKKDIHHEIDPRVNLNINSNELIATAPAIETQHAHQQQELHHHQQQQQHHIGETGKAEVPLFTPEADITVIPTAELHHQTLPEVTPTHHISHEVVHIPAQQQHSAFSSSSSSSAKYNTIAHSSHDTHSKY